MPAFSIFGTFPVFIFAVIDEYNTPVHANLAPLIIGVIVVAVDEQGRTAVD